MSDARDARLRTAGGESAGPQVPVTAAPLQSLAGYKVLIVGHDPCRQTAFDLMFEALAARPAVVRTIADALRRIAEERFDLVLFVPECAQAAVPQTFAGAGPQSITGLCAMAVLRAGAMPQAGEVQSDLPVLATISRGQTGQRDAALAAGASAVLPLPVSCIADLARACADLVPRARIHASGAQAVVMFDPDRLLQLLAIATPAVGDELLDRLQADLLGVAQGLRHGVAVQDGGELRAQTHILMALAGAVGAERLQNRAERLNVAAQAGDRDAAASLVHQSLYLIDHLVRFVADEARRRAAAQEIR